jgi:hypothetical protein
VNSGACPQHRRSLRQWPVYLNEWFFGACGAHHFARQP